MSDGRYAPPRRVRDAVRELGLGAALGAAGLAVVSQSAALLASRAREPASAVLASARADASTPPPADGASPSDTGRESPDPASSSAPAATAPEVASYELSARLDGVAHSITGKGTIRWTNASTAPVRELFLHLYLNAFKNDRTLFLRSPFGAGRSGDHATAWGYIDVTRFVVRDLSADDLWPKADKTSPGDPDDQTDIRVPLPAAIEPGRTVSIELEWISQLPEIVERTGYAGSFHFVGQWYPKLAKLEPDGRWAHFAFHPQAEFYADFGNYSVTLDVPANQVVGATGRRVLDEPAADRRRLRFEATGVHDFAFAAWDRFQERSETIDGVDVRLLYPPGNGSNAERTLEALRFGLPRYSRLFGRYPHPTLTVVHPPDYARNAGGMEYPTLITTGGPWWASASGVRLVEAVTVHELGHQWFQGIIASNEPKWPFLDEGVNTWAEVETMSALYGSGALIDVGGLQVSDEALRRLEAMEATHDDPIAQPASQFASFASLGALVYGRTAIVLSTLGAVWGRDSLERALGQYARSQRFRHPEPAALESAVEQAMGRDAAAALHTALFEKGWLDYAVEDLGCVSAPEPAGVFERESGRVTLDPAAAEDGEGYHCRALVRRLGTLRIPADVELWLDDGSRERRTLDAERAWTSVERAGKRRVVAVVVDPERRISLDMNLANNVRRERPAFAYRTLERATYAAELALGWVGP